MARRALLLAGWVCSTLGLGLGACGNGTVDPFEPRPPDGQSGEGGEGTTGGTAGTTGGTGNGGDGAGASGGSRGGTAGRGGSAGRPGSTGGASSGGSSSGTGGDGGDGSSGEGGEAGGGIPDPVVCDRFGAGPAAQIAGNVAFAYDRTRHGDCRLAWFETLFLPPIGQRAEYVRAITHQTLVLWGCIDEPPTGFSLVYGSVPLSQAEVNALIDVYLDASRIEAQLSPAEVAPIQRELERLAAPLVDSSLADFSRSRCPGGGTGGTGGTGGIGGQSGAGGQNDDGGEGGAGGVATL